MTRLGANDVARIAAAVEAALPDANPCAVVLMLAAQLPHVSGERGCAVLDQIARQLSPEAWDFTDELLDAWPAPVAQRALAHVRALPAGCARIRALCLVARRLTLEERREALDGILDGTLPQLSWDYTKPMSHSLIIAGLVRTLPEAWQDEWLATHSDSVRSEWLARRDIGRFPEDAMRALWQRIDHASAELPEGYFWVARSVPADLKAVALQRIRACTSRDDRLHHLGVFDAELTDTERRELVERAMQEQNLHWRMDRLARLLPATAEERRQTEQAVVAHALRDGRLPDAPALWHLVPDDVLAAMLTALRTEPHGWKRDDVIRCLVTCRAPALADRCLMPLLDELSRLPSDHCLEIVTAMTPWLAERSDRMVPAALTALPLPVLRHAANPQWTIARALADSHET